MCVLFQGFAEWNKSELDSFLIEITRDILKFKDEKNEYLVEKIRDTAGQVRYYYLLFLLLFCYHSVIILLLFIIILLLSVIILLLFIIILICAR